MKLIKIAAPLALAGLLSMLALAPAAQAQEPAYSDDGHEVVIRKGSQGEVYYDYIVNGEVREIRVVPKNGKPYYLRPQDGGYIRLDKSQLLVPSWVLFSW